MLEKLFSSKARVEILRLFLSNPADSFYQKQISDFTSQPIMAVQREIEKLLSLELIEKSMSGKRAYYKANRGNPIFEELKSIFLKFTGVAEALKKELTKNSGIRIAFIYGSYAKEKETISSDIDLFVIGTITARELSSILSKPKQQLGREINYTVMPEQEFRSKVQNKDHFLTRLISEKKIFIIGTQDELKTAIRAK
jgi:predicted nucleotidyltransferase